MERLPYEVALERQLARKLEKELRRLKASQEGVKAATLSPTGAEILDPTPLVKAIKGNTMADFDQVRAFIREQISPAAGEAGQETFEEFMDMDVEDDTGLEMTPYEKDADNFDEHRTASAERQESARLRQAFASHAKAQRSRKNPKKPVDEQLDDGSDGGDDGANRGQAK